jgi:hypothetical protein
MRIVVLYCSASTPLGTVDGEGNQEPVLKTQDSLMWIVHPSVEIHRLIVSEIIALSTHAWLVSV